MEGNERRLGETIAPTLQHGAKPAKRRRQARRAPLAEMGERVRRYEVLLNVARRVGSKESLDEVLDSLIESTSHDLGCERSSFFLHDPQTGELYSHAAQGVLRREIRFPATAGIAGAVFQGGEAVIVDDAYADPRFNPDVDQTTGFTTRNILAVPMRATNGDLIGVAQCLNKIDGVFSEDDRALLEAISEQAIPALRSSQFIERMSRARAKEMEFLGIVSDISSQLDLDSLLQRIMSEVTRMLGSERSTLFINDERTNQLFSRLAQGNGVFEIRLPNTQGIAGSVFTSGKTMNIPYAYADLRFDPSFDRQTGFFTRSILCTPVINKQGKIIGVTQTLNKKGGPFTEEDEQRLKAFTAQMAIALENAKLFDDVQKMKSYNDSMLESMSNGVVTLDDKETIVTCNAAGLRILKVASPDVVGHRAPDFFVGKSAWIVDSIRKVQEQKHPDISVDREIEIADDTVSVNLTVLPLRSGDTKQLGTLLTFEDISTEKRLKATMGRYMDPTIAAQLLEKDAEILGGVSKRATILFSDIRGFTTLTEALGAHGTVEFLNAYFSQMVDCIDKEEGILDKFIGDAIMAVFGLPLSHDDDEDRAVRASIAMIRACRKWSAERAQRGEPPVDMGIGLNTDTVVSGNIGSPKRMNYTIIGDGVNLASRLESACKAYSARILISENTFAGLHGTYRMRNIDRVVVKGKTEPVGVYEVLDYHTPETFPNMMDVIGYFSEGMTHYTAGRFAQAIEKYRQALSKHPQDRLSATYIERCQYLIDHPPEEEWIGVWVMKEK